MQFPLAGMLAMAATCGLLLACSPGGALAPAAPAEAPAPKGESPAPQTPLRANGWGVFVTRMNKQLSDKRQGWQTIRLDVGLLNMTTETRKVNTGYLQGIDSYILGLKPPGSPVLNVDLSIVAENGEQYTAIPDRVDVPIVPPNFWIKTSWTVDIPQNTSPARLKSGGGLSSMSAATLDIAGQQWAKPMDAASATWLQPSAWRTAVAAVHPSSRDEFVRAQSTRGSFTSLTGTWTNSIPKPAGKFLKVEVEHENLSGRDEKIYITTGILTDDGRFFGSYAPRTAVAVSRASSLGDGPLYPGGTQKEAWFAWLPRDANDAFLVAHLAVADSVGNLLGPNGTLVGRVPSSP